LDVDAALLGPDGTALERDLVVDPRRRRRLPRSLFVAGALAVTLALVAVVGPLLAPYNPVDGTGGATLAAPSLGHLMGTDLYGRDIFTRVLYGARIALGVSTACVAVALIIGTLWGLLAGYTGGAVAALMMRAVDIVISFPYIVLVIAVLAVLGPGLFTIFLAIAVVDWTTYARLVYSQVLSVREREYVEACRALGMPSGRIMLRHILPNVATAAIVYATLDVSQVILTISALNFLGLGVQPPIPDWGYMVNEGRTFIYTSWWISTFPGVAIMLTGLIFGLLGDGLADALDVPR